MSKLLLYGTFIQCLLLNFLVAAPSEAQQIKTVHEVKVKLRNEETSIMEVLLAIESSTNFKFSYYNGVFNPNAMIKPRGSNRTVSDVLLQISEETGLSFKQINNNIRIQKKLQVVSDQEKEIEVVIDGIEITGKVTTMEDPEGLPGVNIVVQGTSNGTITDLNGSYTITVPDETAVLVFSSVGFVTEHVVVGSQTSIDLVMIPDITALEEIVVVGYGTVKKSDLTGSVAQVSEEEITAYPAYNIEESLRGRASGVRVTQNSGQPGSRVEVRIRGANSMIGGNYPLYVVDGFPITGGIEHLNPADIESIDILKDASATAIYGSRGANGVVIITSKRGKGAERGTIDISSYYGVQQTINRYDMLDAKEYAVVANEWLVDNGDEPYFNVDEVQNPGTDWQDAIFRAAPIQDHTITFNGSSDKTNYSFSGNYFSQDGVVINSGVKRGSLRLNLDHQVKEWLKLGVNMSLSRRERYQVPVDNGYYGNSVLSGALAAPPTLPVYDENGLPTRIETIYSFGSIDMRNPMTRDKPFKDMYLHNSVLGNTTLEVTLAKGLTFKTLLGVDYMTYNHETFSPIIYSNDRGGASSGSNYETSLLNENILSYSKSFDDNNVLNLVGGFTYQTYRDQHYSISVSGFANNTTENYDLGAAETINPPTSGIKEWTLASWLGRANYTLMDRYLFTVSVRADGSSRFGENNKWGMFPSGAFAWRVSDEAFMQDVSAISDLKLRTSYGVTGNTALNPYQSLDRLSSTKYIFGDQKDEIGYVPSGIANSDLKWETTAQMDIGIDLSFVENRFRFTVDYYRKNTRDLLASVPLPPSVGFGSTLQNIGEIQNSGFEFSFGADIFTGEFKWDVNTQISTNKNEVVSLAGGDDIYGSGVGNPFYSSMNIAREGEPFGMFFGLQEDGLDENGYIKYVDNEEDGVINNLDRVILGNPYPDFFYGLSSNMSYKNFDLFMFFEGVQGNDIFWATAGSHLNSFQRGTNQFADLYGNYWTADNPDPNAKYPKISKNTAVNVSDRFIKDGSYLRVKTVKLAYNIPVKQLGWKWIGGAQVYVSGSNLFTVTNYPGLDPEVNTRGTDGSSVENQLRIGIDESGYPNAKTYAAGLRLNF
jgi:TonB-linked SusC/RagA family outer membrane protein